MKQLGATILSLTAATIAVASVAFVAWPHLWPFGAPGRSLSTPWRMQRPYGMAPVAYEAYLRACWRTGIHPNRIGQTLGDHPLSKGYHRRDGITHYQGNTIEYSAAIDLGVGGLTRPQIDRFLDHLAQQGFASFYRHGGKWKRMNNEHIHAIYVFLPMKSQLQGQVAEFLGKRRRSGLKPLKWEKKLRRQREHLQHWDL